MVGCTHRHRHPHPQATHPHTHTQKRTGRRSQARPSERAGRGSCGGRPCTRGSGRGSSWAGSGRPRSPPPSGVGVRSVGRLCWVVVVVDLTWPSQGPYPPIPYPIPSTAAGSLTHLVKHPLLVKVEVPARLPQVQVGHVRRVEQLVPPALVLVLGGCMSESGWVGERSKTKGAAQGGSSIHVHSMTHLPKVLDEPADGGALGVPKHQPAARVLFCLMYTAWDIMTSWTQQPVIVVCMYV